MNKLNTLVLDKQLLINGNDYRTIITIYRNKTITENVILNKLLSINLKNWWVTVYLVTVYLTYVYTINIKHKNKPFDKCYINKNKPFDK